MILKKKGFQLAGGIFFVMFAVLLMVRLDLFKSQNGIREHDKTFDFHEKNPPTFMPGETWMTILQNGKHIGFSCRFFKKTSSGYSIHEKTAMTINTMGIPQNLVVRMDGNTGSDLSLRSFDFGVDSGRFKFKVTGTVENLLLKMTTATHNKEPSSPVEIKLKTKPYLAGLIAQAMTGSFNGTGNSDSRIFSVFDPVTMGEMAVRVKAMGEELMEVMGKKIAVKKLSLQAKGMTQYAFVDETGRVVKEEGLLGITLVAATKEQAVEGIVPGDDFTLVASVLPTWALDIPGGDQLKTFLKLVLIITGIDTPAFDLAGGRQSFNNDRLTITRESLFQGDSKDAGDLKSSPDSKFNNDIAQFLLPAPFIQSDHPEIVDLARKIVKKEKSTIGKIQAILAWMNKHIKQRPVISLPDALLTLKNRMGDCNDYSVLFAAFCRSLGIPARIEAGLVLLNGRFYYHAWNAVFLDSVPGPFPDSWITVDSLFNQFPADVTHIRLSTGKGADGFDLMGAIGRIKIKIVGAEP